MKYSTKLSDTIHLLIFLYLGEGQKMTSARIAESVKTNPAYIRQLMSALKNAGLISSTQGQAKTSLTKDPRQITMLDVYRAVEGGKPLLHLDIHTNPQCGVGVNIQLSIGDFYKDIQQVAEKKMNEITLWDIIECYYKRSVDEGGEGNGKS
ncbi:MAG TPA: Rrf2 family transcriptional regulator [Candidatus Eubacterium avistercoris]|mgnify:CR=1 FL=1|uniref:Rrf2 family transcriptional regulator n=1 Tax=Candidatus Eubacterium avistercoris TaxID=2838567 RepID=A0A9D2IH07_9FIRM|nr:Rrf2 family transcriptional regulator [Candidatus Eubacterium avistercoris]